MSIDSVGGRPIEAGYIGGAQGADPPRASLISLPDKLQQKHFDGLVVGPNLQRILRVHFPISRDPSLVPTGARPSGLINRVGGATERRSHIASLPTRARCSPTQTRQGRGVLSRRAPTFCHVSKGRSPKRPSCFRVLACHSLDAPDRLISTARHSVAPPLRPSP